MTAASDYGVHGPEQVSGLVPVSSNEDSLFRREPKHPGKKRRDGTEPREPHVAEPAPTDAGTAQPPAPKMDDKHLDVYL